MCSKFDRLNIRIIFFGTRHFVGVSDQSQINNTYMTLNKYTWAYKDFYRIHLEKIM